MDGNKDEAMRCVRISEEAIASGNKQRALKFIGMAQRLNHNLRVDDLMAACENLCSDSPATSSEKCVNRDENRAARTNEGSIGEKKYTDKHVLLIKQISESRDYYEILGVEKSCSSEEIRKAYRKLSLKVHPDKNKAPGSEEAFKKVCKAFKCLGDDSSRRHYDQTGFGAEFEYNQHVTRRRTASRTSSHDLFEEDFDPDEIFRSFFGQTDLFRGPNVFRARGVGSQPREHFNGGRPNFMVLLQILPFLLIFLLAYLPLSEPDYSLQKNYNYQISKETESHHVEFYVKSSEFDQKYPPGSETRASIEESIYRDYKNMLGRYCHIELQRRHWNRNLPVPHCDKLRGLGVRVV